MTQVSFAAIKPEQATWVGALDFDMRPGGISPRRLPAWTRPQVPQGLDVMLRMPSGVRLRFETDSRSVAVSVLVTNMKMGAQPKRPVVFDLEVGDELLSRSTTEGNTIVYQATGDFEVQRGQPATLTFDQLEPGPKVCELWLPHNAFVELHSLTLDPGATLRAAPDDRPHWVHYGSSISHCMEALQPGHIWPAVAARRAGAALQNLGFGGQCHLDPFVARTIRDSGADLISVKVGINIVNMDSMRERIFQPLLHGFLDTIREGRPDTPIVLISPIYCPSAEDHPGPTVPNADGKFGVIGGSEELRAGSMSLSRIRELIREVIQSRGEPALHYLDGLELFGEADVADLPDALHPNPQGYVRMGERFAEKMLGSLVAASGQRTT